jgi:hypothetical protein
MVLVSAAAVGVALYRASKRLLSPYRAAQVVDRRLQLADTISTAVFFGEQPAQVSPALRQFQRERANQAAQSADVRLAVPYAMPRGVYLMAVLTLVAGSRTPRSPRTIASLRKSPNRRTTRRHR